MAKARTEHIILQSTDYQKNRHRIYRIVIKMNQVVPLYKVTCSWGRVGGFGQAKVFAFDNEAGMVKFIQGLLMKRKRNGYGVIEKTEGFPNCKALELIPDTEAVDGQLELFKT